MDEALAALRADLVTCELLEKSLRGRAGLGSSKLRALVKRTDADGDPSCADADVPPPVTSTKPKMSEEQREQRRAQHCERLDTVLQACVDACKESRKRHRDESPPDEQTDDVSLSQHARFTREMALAPYQQFLHYVPRLVNVVTLAEALPMPGSGLTLPLDLSMIAARCKGSFYAPRRFAAVQLAYSTPRCRVLVFRCQGAAAARLVISRAQRQLSEEAGVHLHVRNFAVSQIAAKECPVYEATSHARTALLVQVINQVGAASLRATLNCDAFASEHSSESHFDRSSFVGLAWRPPRENICCELLRFSSANHLLAKIPEELQAHHRVVKTRGSQDENGPSQHEFVVANKTRQKLTMVTTEKPKKQEGIWDNWGDAAPSSHKTSFLFGDDDDDEEELDLNALGM